MKLAIVIPIYNEQENLRELYRRIAAACDTLPLSQWQLLYVDDGSTDGSLAIMREQLRADGRVSCVELSRNFGHQAATLAGLALADADGVITMDGDLQDPPEVIPELVAAWQRGAEVVLAQRITRQDTGLRAGGFALFHLLFKWITDFRVPENVGIFSLLDKVALAELKRCGEWHLFLPGLRSWIGFRQEIVPYERQGRHSGEPKQSLRRLTRYALDAVFSFSYKPLRAMTALGLLVSFVGFASACYFVGFRILGDEKAFTGFTTLVTIVLFLGGIQLLSLGLLGEYLGRIYDEVKGRPRYIVRRVHAVGNRHSGSPHEALVSQRTPPSAP